MCSSINCKKIYFLFKVCWIANCEGITPLWWYHVLIGLFSGCLCLWRCSLNYELWWATSEWMRIIQQTRPLTQACLCLIEIVLIEPESDLTQVGEHQLKTYCYIVSKLHCLEKFIWNNGDLELLSLIFVTKLYSYSSRSLAVEGNNGLLPSQLGSLQYR